MDVEGREGAEKGRELGPQPKSTEGPALGVKASVDTGEGAQAVGAPAAEVAAGERDCEAVRAEDCTAETV